METKYGSTLRGIAPVYGDKYMKKGIRMGDLLASRDVLEEKVANIVEWKNITFTGYQQSIIFKRKNDAVVRRVRQAFIALYH